MATVKGMLFQHLRNRFVDLLLPIVVGFICGLEAIIIIIGELLGIANTKILVTTGMSAALSGVINVPMAAIIIVVEIFGVDYILPAAIGSSIAFILARNWVIYPHIKHIKTP